MKFGTVTPIDPPNDISSKKFESLKIPRWRTVRYFDNS